MINPVKVRGCAYAKWKGVSHSYVPLQDKCPSRKFCYAKLLRRVQSQIMLLKQILLLLDLRTCEVLSGQSLVSLKYYWIPYNSKINTILTVQNIVFML